MSTHLSPTLAIYRPSPDGMRLQRGGNGELYLWLGAEAVWFALAVPSTVSPPDIAEEAAAMRRLATLAAEAAAELEARIAQPTAGRP